MSTNINYKQQTSRCQEKTSKPNFRSYNPLVDPFNYFNNCPLAGKSIYNALVKRSWFFKKIYPSIETIAEEAGVSESSVSKYIHIFHEDKVLWIAGIFGENNLYKIPEFIIKASHKLKPILSAFQIAMFASLVSPYYCQSSKSKTNYLINLNKLTQTKTKNLDIVSQKTKQVACAPVRERKKLTSGEEVMKRGEILGGQPPTVQERLPKALLEMQSIELTQNGQVWLSGFPDEIIRMADKVLCQSGRSVKEPFGYLFGVCLKACKERGIMPDWGKRNQLAMELSVSDNSPMFTKLIDQPTVTKRDSQSRYKPNSGSFAETKPTKSEAEIAAGIRSREMQVERQAREATKPIRTPREELKRLLEIKRNITSDPTASYLGLGYIDGLIARCELGINDDEQYESESNEW